MRTCRHVHSVFNACLGAAARTRRILRNPMMDLASIPSPGEADHGAVLDAEQMRALVNGFRQSALFGIVATAAGTGARRSEILALQVPISTRSRKLYGSSARSRTPNDSAYGSSRQKQNAVRASSRSTTTFAPCSCNRSSGLSASRPASPMERGLIWLSSSCLKARCCFPSRPNLAKISISPAPAAAQCHQGI